MATPVDPASAIIAACVSTLKLAFSDEGDPAPLGGGSADVRFFAGEGPAPAAWNIHTSGGDDCSQPFLWVRVVRRFRTQDFPLPALAASPCSLDRVLEIELGVARCALVDPDPSWDDYAAEAEISLDDSWRVEAAVCAIAAVLTADGAHQVGTDTIAPYGPEGGLLAWTGTVYVSF